MTDFEIPAGVEKVCAVLRGAGHAAHPVGGCVRDGLLRRVPGDWDVATSARPETVMALFERTVPTGLPHGTVTILTESGPVEATTFRREGGYADGRRPDRVEFDADLTEDLARRDFTVNAMALGENGEIIDPWGGLEDLRAGVLRCVGDPDARFAEDALRMLRGVRFSAQLGFTIEEKTLAAMRVNAHRAAVLSGERVKAELEKILLSPRPWRAGELIRLGLLDHLWDGWDRTPDLRAADWGPAGRDGRWRVFCSATGFPIENLPVERSLRRAVRHPELEILAGLALSGGELRAMGLEGAAIGRMQRRLAAYVREHPGENTGARLRALAAEWRNEGT